MAYKEFRTLNGPLYQEISDLVKNKYVSITPIAMKFMREAARFYSTIGQNYETLNSKCTNAHQNI